MLAAGLPRGCGRRPHIDVWVTDQVLQFYDGDQLLRTERRTSTGEVRKKTSLDLGHRGLISNQSVNELAKPARQAPDNRIRRRRGSLREPPNAGRVGFPAAPPAVSGCWGCCLTLG